MKTNWQKLQLHNIFKLSNGKSVSDNYKSIPDEEYFIPVYGGNSVLGYTNRTLISGLNLVIGRVGEYCGNVNMTQGNVWVSDNALFISELFVDIDLKFLNYLLKYLDFNRFSDATGQPKITQSLLKKIKVEIPIDKPEQTAIANILSKVDGAIVATENSIKAAERLKKSLMQNLLTGKLKTDGTWRGDDEFVMVEKFGRVPKGWQSGQLGDIAEVIAGQSPSGETYNDEGKGLAMLNGPTEFTEYFPIPVQYTTKPTKICKVGDILFTVRGSSTGRMNFADQPYCIGRGIAAIRANEESDTDFIYYSLVQIANLILAEAKGAGSTFPNVSRGELLKKKVIFPILKTEQQEIGRQIREAQNIIQTKQSKIKTLERLKKSLMQNLLTGKVRVDVAKIESLITTI
jgi:type I restriction enzyme, S subunit